MCGLESMKSHKSCIKCEEGRVGHTEGKVRQSGFQLLNILGPWFPPLPNKKY